MRSELTLDFYTFHNVARHVLKQRFPRYTNASLSEWFASGTPVENSRVISYYVDMASMLLEVLDEIQIVIKTAEFARVFGIDFFSVLSRGSQFKVESFMLRIAKPESFVLISPSRHQVGMQNAAECFPLIMEPISAFYKSPLLVLDFQSLYPSVMVAYNYCYSTCLGRVKDFKGKNKFGVLDDLEVPPGLLEKVKDHIHIAPNGMIYVKPTVRKSLLAKMLTELLDTRVMVKQGMQLAKGNKPLLRVLDARQLSLKFICNVTYGYTSASFSGRMPAVEIADSIVQAGRETLEKAIHMIESTGEWGAKVVYGDTDSLFVYLPGKTKQQAFVIGNKIADAVTASNPAPVKLKFEKVYLPSVLVAKKRYVGFKFEDPDETTPVFDAKGIETVRRDGIPAGQKMMETSLKFVHQSKEGSFFLED
ncbi:DNA polymerase zeta [Serendipita sp. 397]|nr:DNA polymerase zeta [Serendipita sp. 397]